MLASYIALVLPCDLLVLAKLKQANQVIVRSFRKLENESCVFFSHASRGQKLWFQHAWPSLQQELRTQEVLAAALQPILLIIREISAAEYQTYILPTMRQVFAISVVFKHYPICEEKC